MAYRWQHLTVGLILVVVLMPFPRPATAKNRLAPVAIEYLMVKCQAPKAGYSREAFDPTWADTDRNRCDTRNDVLKRDVTQITYKPGTHNRVVLEGLFPDPYSGENRRVMGVS